MPIRGAPRGPNVAELNTTVGSRPRASVTADRSRSSSRATRVRRLATDIYVSTRHVALRSRSSVRQRSCARCRDCERRLRARSRHDRRCATSCCCTRRRRPTRRSTTARRSNRDLLVGARRRRRRARRGGVSESRPRGADARSRSIELRRRPPSVRRTTSTRARRARPSATRSGSRDARIARRTCPASATASRWVSARRERAFPSVRRRLDPVRHRPRRQQGHYMTRAYESRCRTRQSQRPLSHLRAVARALPCERHERELVAASRDRVSFGAVAVIVLRHRGDTRGDRDERAQARRRRSTSSRSAAKPTTRPRRAASRRSGRSTSIPKARCASKARSSVADGTASAAPRSWLGSVPPRTAKTEDDGCSRSTSSSAATYALTATRGRADRRADRLQADRDERSGRDPPRRRAPRSPSPCSTTQASRSRRRRRQARSR